MAQIVSASYSNYPMVLILTPWLFIRLGARLDSLWIAAAFVESQRLAFFSHYIHNYWARDFGKGSKWYTRKKSVDTAEQ